MSAILNFIWEYVLYVGVWLIIGGVLGNLFGYSLANKLVNVGATILPILVLLAPLWHSSESPYWQNIILSIWLFFLNFIFIYKFQSVKEEEE